MEPTKHEYGNETAYCERLKYNIYRRKPTDCFNYHAEETEIKLCGGAGFIEAWTPLLSFLLLLLALNATTRRQLSLS